MPAPDIWERPSSNTFGSPGLIEMPTAHQRKDADLTTTLSAFDGVQRLTFDFQITERLSGVFRYSQIFDYFGNGSYYDRSFDLRYQLVDETDVLPAVTVGLTDFGGTGVYASEYLVATKTFGRVRATGGIGWGRLGSRGGFENPLGALSDRFKTRGPSATGIETTGQPDTDDWFRGDAAFFGGLEYAVNDRFRLALEYSSDNYTAEKDRGIFEQVSPINIGASYKLRNGIVVSGAYLYGTTAAVSLSYPFNFKQPRAISGPVDPGPIPVSVRASRSAHDLGWTEDNTRRASIHQTLQKVLPLEGMSLDGVSVEATQVYVRVRPEDSLPPARAAGRVARILTAVMPASVETFVITMVSPNGVPSSDITIARSDLEELEFAPDGTWQAFARSRFRDPYSGSLGVTYDALSGFSPNFDWGVGPYVSSSYFDPASPVRLDFGLEGRARWEPVNGMVFTGILTQRFAGNRGDLRESDSTIRRVRSDANIYIGTSDTQLSRLTADYYFRPGKDLYGRVSAGYLEQMYGGVSTELLWKPVDSRLAVGAEVNYVKQRDFGVDFNFQDYEVATGHLSFYYKAKNDFHYQLDLGRYLNEDWGGTLTVDREFDNGIRIGAFATLTDIPFEDFGEGSFDKGIRIHIPFSTFTNTRSEGAISRTIRPVLRDGGARLNVDGRLYEQVRDLHRPAMQEQWGQFLR
ncbi:MAG: YjbH domain-containing protein [Marinovum sp.]|nr:YjbH domain-containing protein [Marinovum sp.]